MKIDFWSEVLPQCILQLFSKKTFSSPRLRLRGFLSYPSSPSTFTTLIARINLKSCVMVQPPFFPFLVFVCPLPHLHHLLTPSALVHLPSAASAPTPRCTCATMLCPHLD